MAIFSLLSAFSASFAWFTAMRKNTESTDNFEIKSAAGKLKKVTFHQMTDKYIGDSYEESTFSFDKDPVGTLTYNWDTKAFVPTGTTAVKLENYDYLDHEQPLLMLIELNEEYDDSIVITLNTDSDEQSFIGARNSDQTAAHELDDESLFIKTVDGKPYFGLSSAVKFHTIQYSEDDFEDAFGESDVYEYTNLNNQKSFVTVNNVDDSSSFSTTISPLIQTSGAVKYIAVVIDYYSDAIEYIYSTFLGDTTLEDDYDSFLYFVCDWSMEVL